MVTLAAGLTRTEIEPPYAHMHLEVLLSAGMPPISTVGDPGVHGVVTGMHGAGVSTPSAAAVSDATIGLLNEVHMPNGGMFAIGMQSVIVATGRLTAIVFLAGGTTSVDGASPNVHMIVEPITTGVLMGPDGSPRSNGRG
jgi:hypothetical protein